MTSEWELTADTLKLAYAGGISVNPHEDQADQYECGVCMEAHALVDRFIARIKAEAWDEGAAYVNAPFGVEPGMRNPYRPAGEQ